MLNAIALDDEPLALQLLQAYGNQTAVLDTIETFSDATQAAKRLEVGDVDLLFLDIQMPDITGLQFFNSLSLPPMVIFTTAFAEYAAEGFNLDAVDYLVKPFELARFQKAVQKAADYQRFLQLDSQDSNQKGDSLFVKAEYSVVKIPFDDIVLIEGFDDYIKIHAGGKPVLTLMSLKGVFEKLPPGKFLRVHRSYIIALDRAESLRRGQISIAGRQVPVGDRYLSEVRAAFGA
jgi:DNA-binding LytR/AlgR family response regulator